MAWEVVPTAVTGDIVAAAWGNRVRDNSAYLKGRAGNVAIESSASFSGVVTAPGFSTTGAAPRSASTTAATAPGGSGAAGGYARLYSAALGDLLQVGYATGSMNWLGTANDRDTGIPPNRLRRVTRFGMRGAGGGTHTLAYLGDGRLDYIHFPDGLDATSTLTFHYDGLLRVQTIWLRDGGAAGTGLNWVGFTYNGSGQVATIAEG